MRQLLIVFSVVLISSCHSSRVLPGDTSEHSATFWAGLRTLCGNAYLGEVIAAPANDTAFRNKTLIMHVRSCENELIRIPLTVGDNRSRTWVISKAGDRLRLKHDHRHPDGKEDSITQYGGITPNHGSATLQMFPADQHTVTILPAAATNVWARNSTR